MNKKVKIIGLTGGIGTGKSTAAEYLRGKGMAHVDADEISRSLTADGSPMLKVLDDTFGPEAAMGKHGVDILKSDGSLDRKALASLVFTDPQRKRKLDELMFGAIISEIDRSIDELQSRGGVPAILLDAPLLFEGGLESRCDVVVLLVADMDIRIARVCARDGAAPEEVGDRIRNQMSDEEKIARADIIIDNSGTQEMLFEKIENCMKNIL
ncbi:MAG: dephospho-CoA kinase [Lentihominibacter sp.]